MATLSADDVLSCDYEEKGVLISVPHVAAMEGMKYDWRVRPR